MCVGAFDERIKLTIPQESGSGGDANWRVSDYMNGRGQSTQTLNEITGENCWFRQNFSQFNSTATKLPFDQHSIIGLIAPRACLLIENTILWLGPESGWISANAAHIIWESLLLYDHMGFSQYTHTSSHCGFQSVQQPEVTAYVQRFLVGNDSTANTDILQNDLGFGFDFSKWLDWGPFPITTTQVEGQLSSIPTGYTLEQNYPNPFNPSTVISFSIPQNAFVSLKVYTPLGQEIAELAGKEFSAGRHTVTFDASNLASGVYYCSIKVKDFSMVEKMTLQK